MTNMKAFADHLDALATAQPSGDHWTTHALQAGARALRVEQDELGFALAQLRHAYHQLIGPDAAWNRDARCRFADGLIGPQIVRLERLHAQLGSVTVVEGEASGLVGQERERLNQTNKTTSLSSPGPSET